MAGDLVQSWDEDRILNSDSHAQENVCGKEALVSNIMRRGRGENM